MCTSVNAPRRCSPANLTVRKIRGEGSSPPSVQAPVDADRYQGVVRQWYSPLSLDESKQLASVEPLLTGVGGGILLLCCLQMSSEFGDIPVGKSKFPKTFKCCMEYFVRAQWCVEEVTIRTVKAPKQKFQNELNATQVNLY